MNAKPVFRIVSFVLIVMAVSMAFCGGLAWLMGDPPSAIRSLLLSAGFGFAIGVTMFTVTDSPKELTRRDGFGIVAFGWLAAAVYGAMPFIFSGVILSPVSAIFETMSGFTTTGASVLSDLESVPNGIIFWRALTHWFGGMGVLVLVVAILPFLGVGGMQIYRAEIPGPSKDRLTPRIATTAKYLWGVYVLISAVEAVLLKLAGMSWFDSACHTFATMATGGFSTRTASVAAYNSVAIDVIIIVFMFIAGVNFALHFRALRGDVKSYWRDPEFRFYTLIWLSACLFMTFNTWGTVYKSFGHALRSAFFQGTSILTTTGFVTENFDQWPNPSRILLVLMMFIGGCAGSTGGGMKNVRVLILAKKMIREIRLFMQPKAVVRVKLADKPVQSNVVSNIAAFALIFGALFSITTFVMTFFTPDLETAFSSVIATLGNIGPGLAGVGAVQNYAEIPQAGQIILTLCMLLGRLELYTVLIIFLPSFWKK